MTLEETLKDFIKSTKKSIEKTNATIAESEKRTNATIAESEKRTNAMIAESEKRTNAGLDRLEKQVEKTEALVAKTSSTVKGIGHSNGIVAETFFEDATEGGVTLKIDGEERLFEQTAVNLVLHDKKLSPKAEFDIVLTNCDYLLLIEVKYRLDDQVINTEDKNEDLFYKKISALKTYEPEAVEGKRLLTGFASLGAKKEVKDFLNQNGHFVFTQKNETIETAYPVGF